MEIGVYDIETLKPPPEVGWSNFKDMGMSVGCVLILNVENTDGSFKKYKVDEETYFEPKRLAKRLNTLDLVVGFNNNSFDNNIICEHTAKDQKFLLNSLDILEDLTGETKIKYLTNLDDLAETTIEEGKDCQISANAPELWSKGERQKVIDQCLKDVEITAKVFVFGLKNGYVLTKPNKGDLFGQMVLKVPVKWAERI